ncbi:MAG: anti-sigma factor [Acidobacteria bacterium]|nr:anti-sigma factor [Acidobacteriota bacterium]
MTTPHHDVIAARLSDYALGYLTPDERREVEQHAGQCDACSQELSELLLVMDGLARSAEPVVPPAALKQRVLARLGRETQEGVATVQPLPGRTVVADVRRSGWSGAWLAAAAALLLVAGGSLYLALERQDRITSELARVAGEITELQQRLGDNAAQADMVLSILTAQDMRRIDLASAGGTQASAARAYWSPTRGLLVAADNLPVPPPGRVYQVWLIGSGGGPVSAGMLGSLGAGRGLLIAPPPGGISTGPVTVAVTDEPPGGLPAPTGGKHLIGSL